MQFVRILTASLLLTALPALAQPAPKPQPDITIKLPLHTWDVVIQGLAELPLKVSAPIVQAIQEQAKTQLEPEKQAEKPKK